MARKHTTEVDTHQLELELASLKLVVSNKEQQLDEAKLKHTIDRARVHTETDTSNNNCAHASHPAVTTTPPRAINTVRATSMSSPNSEHSVVPTYQELQLPETIH